MMIKCKRKTCMYLSEGSCAFSSIDLCVDSKGVVHCSNSALLEVDKKP